MKPVAGIVGRTYDLEKPYSGVRLPSVYSPLNYLAYFRMAGCDALIIDPNGDFSNIIHHIDILVMTGGVEDVDPSYYGQQRHPKTKSNRDLDLFEFGLFRSALEYDIPVFGICRGFQVINVALGGTIRQHLPDWSTEIDHDPNEPFKLVHTVETRGWLKDVVGETIQVNSWHHQGVDQLAPDLIPLAWSPDGLVEAFEMKYGASVFAVQWHPEILADTNSLSILKAFLGKSFPGI